MTLAESYTEWFPDDSPEPSPRKAYWRGVSEVLQRIGPRLFANAPSPAVVGALQAIMGRLEEECRREGPSRSNGKDNDP